MDHHPTLPARTERRVGPLVTARPAVTRPETAIPGRSTLLFALDGQEAGRDQGRKVMTVQPGTISRIVVVDGSDQPLLALR
jgi:hypothetical protein